MTTRQIRNISLDGNVRNSIELEEDNKTNKKPNSRILTKDLIASNRAHNHK